MDCSSASAADRTIECRDGDQCPKDRNPICFTSQLTHGRRIPFPEGGMRRSAAGLPTTRVIHFPSEGCAMSFVMTVEEREEFLAGVHVGVVAVDRLGRAPLATPVW